MIKVLAIDGGGIRGIIPAVVLARIEQKMGKRINEIFDFVVGTSTGGMLSLALSRRSALEARAMIEIYAEYGPSIFYRGWRWTIRSMGNLNGPKYDVEALEKACRACMSKDVMGQSKIRSLVTSYDIKRRAPQFFSDYDTPLVPMVDAALATSAAPTYFAPHKNYVDGGVCDNNPALSGVIEACKLSEATVRECLVLSLGTGSDNVAMDGQEAASWGLLTWAQKLPSIFMDGTSGLHEYHLRRLLPDANVLRLQCSVDGTLAEMDNATTANVEALKRAGTDLVTTEEARIDTFLKRLA